MKKALIGTTALIAVGLLNVAAAQAADKIKLSVGGYYNTGIGFSSEDDGVGEAGAADRNHAINIDSEISFRGSTTLDNGIEVGFQAELEVSDGTVGNTFDRIDEHYVWFENTDVWGRVEIGDRDGAEAKTMVFGPLVNGATITGLTAMTWRNGPAAAANDAFIGPIVLGGALFLADSTKVTYYTPKFSGLQLGASYTPERAENQKGLATDSTAGELSEGKAIGANWSGSMGDAAVRASAGWSSADAEGVNENDRTQWVAGFNVSMNGWQFGGGYVNDETGGGSASTVVQRDNIQYRVGLVYSTGPYTSGIEYADQSVDTATGEDSATVWSIQGKKSLGAGVSVGVGVRQWSWEDADSVAASEHDATEYFFVTAVSF
jgi:outer membrane protein OmpU